MATQNIKTTIIPRKDTYANWTASTAKVLAAGEFGLDTTNNILKCGDGTNTWANLPELNETTLIDLGITATAAEINKLDGLTATTAELNYVDGVTSAIQTQLDKKAPKSHATSATTYGVATTSNYGHVKISNGDVATVNSANGVAAGMDHSHSNYSTTDHTHSQYAPVENPTFTEGVTINKDLEVNENAFVYGHLSVLNDTGNLLSGTSVWGEDADVDLEIYSDGFGLYDANNDIRYNIIFPKAEGEIALKENTLPSTTKYAASSSAGGAATSANKVNKSLKVQLNSGTTEGTSQFTFDGSTAKTVNITPSSIGAATSGHTHSSYVNQNAFSNVKVGSTTVAADTTTDTISFEGNNITITGDATNDKVTFGLTKTNVTTALGYTPPTQDTTYSAATTSAAGLMSAADKTKLNGIATGATANKGTVTSVRVQAGTGLSSSVSTAQTGSLNTTISIASGYKLPTSTEWSDVMKKSGNETARGLKTFYDGITFGTWDGTLGGDGCVGELIYSPVGSIILIEEGSDSTLISVTTDGDLALTNLTAPTNDSDAATKYYVDQTVDDAKPSVVGSNGTTGLIKNGSTVTSTSGLTACPIISGVPYYKDTNTQSAYGNVTTSGTITATAVKTASGVVVVDSSNKIQKVTSMSDFRTIIGAGTSNLAIGTTASTAAAGNHSHSGYLSTSTKYAGSSSAGGAANSVKTNLTIKLNGGSVEGTSLFTFNGSTAKTINITPAAIGALSTNAADDSDTWGETTTSKLPTKRSVAAYTNANFAEKGHKHTASLATDTGTSAITLGHGGKYKLTAGGSSVIFTMPSATYLATKLAASTGIAGGSSESDYTGYLPILKNAPSSTSENSVCYLASGMSDYAGATKMAFGDMIGHIGGVRLGDSSRLSHNVWVSGFVLNQTPTNAMQHMPLAMWSDPTNTYSAGLGLTSSGEINLRTTGQQILVRNSESNALDPTSYDGYRFTFPNKNGTIALTSDIPTFKTINGNTITGSGDIEISSASDLSFYEGDIGTVNKHPEDIWATHINAIDYMEVRSDNQSFISNAVLDSTGDGEDIDTIYCSNGIKMTDANSGDVFELAFPARSGVLSLKGHTHSVSAIKSINYSSYSKSATIASNRDTYQSSYCANSYWQTKIYGDIQSIGPSTGTVFRVVVYSETNAILSDTEITGRDLHFFVPGFDLMLQSGAPGYPINIILFEKFNDTDYYVLGQIVRNANSNSSTRVSRVLVEYSDPDDSGILTIFEVGQKKTSASSITSGGSNY